MGLSPSATSVAIHSTRGKIVLSSTIARPNFSAVFDQFERLGGTEARQIAEAFWTEPNTANREEYFRVCGPLYTQSPGNLFDSVETIHNNKLFAHCNDAENQTFDMRTDLAQAQCPVLAIQREFVTS